MAAGMASDAVFGHYMQQGDSWQALLPESNSLFKSVVDDVMGHVEQEVEADAAKLNGYFLVLHWINEKPEGGDAAQNAGKTSVSVKHRTLLMLAVFHGSLRVISYLLSKGADPKVKSPDNLTAYDFAASGNSPHLPTIIAMLKDAETNYTMSGCQVDQLGRSISSSPRTSYAERTSYSGLGMDMQDGDCDPFNTDSLPYSTAELTRPEYATDNFRMFCFKVLRCSKRYAHDWRACPFAHPTENARRRDPRDIKYCSISCPDYKQGFCIRGDICPYSHGVFESWLHPSRYRTQLCKDGAGCRRPVCFFAHSLQELRAATYTFAPTSEDLLRTPAVYAKPQVSVASPPAEYASSKDHSPTGSRYSDYGERVSPNSPLDLVLTSPTGGRALAKSPVPSQGPGGGALQTQSQAQAQAQVQAQVDAQAEALVQQAQAQAQAHQAQAFLDLASRPTATTTSLQRSKSLDAHLSGTKIVNPIAEAAPSFPIKAYSGSSMPVPGSLPAAPIAQPRMSNAFARRHGLNPKDNPLLNLQKIAYAGQVVPPMAPSYERPPAPVHPGMRRSQSHNQRSKTFVQQQQQQQQQQAVAVAQAQAQAQQVTGWDTGTCKGVLHCCSHCLQQHPYVQQAAALLSQYAYVPSLPTVPSSGPADSATLALLNQQLLALSMSTGGSLNLGSGFLTPGFGSQ